jgi:hypothetical protein
MTLDAEQRRALVLLAGSRDGLTDDLLLTQGFTVELLVGLIRDGLATAKAEHLRAGRSRIEVARIRITDAGRKALMA